MQAGLSLLAVVACLTPDRRGLVLTPPASVEMDAFKRASSPTVIYDALGAAIPPTTALVCPCSDDVRPRRNRDIHASKGLV